MSTVRIPHWFQGPTGSGQGGWTTARFVDIIGQPATVAIRAPIPLDTDLTVVSVETGPGPQRWQLIDNSRSATSTNSDSDPTPSVIMEAERWDPNFTTTSAVGIEEARAARKRFPVREADHPVPHCFSCGTQHDSMGVQAGPLPDGRYATDWQAPEWSVGVDGSVDGAVLWAALDCTAAWYVGYEGGNRPAFTVQYAVEVSEAVTPNETYALVAWGTATGDSTNTGWDGRKRAGASAAFNKDGACIARSRSLWVAV